jgi:superfamily II DNA or RNA helicase
MKIIYIYQTPDSKKDGLIKIGDTERNSHTRIKEQLNGAGVHDAGQLDYELIYETKAVKEDDTEFSDKTIHKILHQKGYLNHKVFQENLLVKNDTEWFKIDADKVIHLIEKFKEGLEPEKIDIDRFQDFPMRPEQEAAVLKTEKYFLSSDGKSTTEVLWNAKMRFGKTFTAYQLVKKMNFTKTLILTYKPAVEDAWKKDLEHHKDFKDYVFLKRDSLSSINSYLDKGEKIVAFASYQDLLGENNDGTDIKERHLQLFETHWDIVIIDEFHYGSSTKKAQELIKEKAETKKEEKAQLKELHSEEDEEQIEEEISEEIEKIVEKSATSDYRLFLSGTPFRAIADSKFEKDAIFNWTYTDEQRAKEQWNIDFPDKKDSNPYKSLPQIQMFVYKVSKELIEAGKDVDKDEFSLNHFFKASKGKFINETAVIKWLNLISGVTRPHAEIADEIADEIEIQPSQYPFDHEGDLVKELDHTLWYFNRVDTAVAMKKLLENHSIFKTYHIILAAGKNMKSGVDAVEPVLSAIDSNKKTITLTVGKLTTGVSVPKWKAVMFLRDTESPENYFQTAFRAQTPFKDKATGYMKEKCYIFDFSPNRSLKLLTSYSEKLTTDSHLTTSEERITEFIKYLPVLKVAGNTMVNMDARSVLTFDLSGIDAKGLGERFIERKNIAVTREVIDAINSSPETQDKCKEIFEKIKMFKRFSGASDKEMKNSDVDIANLDVNNNKIKKLEGAETKTEKEEKEKKKEIDEAEKDLKSERDKVRELLKTLLSRVPIFMYLTDATEENLEQVLVETKKDLFRKATGITTDDFRYLRDVGLIKIDSIDGYILKFVQLENQNFETNNELIN